MKKNNWKKVNGLSDDRFYTLTEVSKILGLHIQTLKHRLKIKTLFGRKMDGRQWAFTKKDIEQSMSLTPKPGRVNKLTISQLDSELLHGESKTEIAKKYGVTQSAISKTIARAPKNLKKRLAKLSEPKRMVVALVRS